MEAEKLLKLYKEKQNKQSSIAEEFAPVFAKILQALADISSKELPVPIIEVAQPNVMVDAPQIKNEVNVPEIKIPKISTPEVIIKENDYSAAFIALTDAVNNLSNILKQRPTSWKVERDNRGFIQKVNGQ